MVLLTQAEEAAEYVNFLSSLPHLSAVVKENRRPLLPPQQPGTERKTLVLDLDHTLIRSTQHSLNKAKVTLHRRHLCASALCPCLQPCDRKLGDPSASAGCTHMVA